MQTVPGGICSLITAFSLFYYILVNIISYWVNQTYEVRSSTQAIYKNQDEFTISLNQLNLLTKIMSDDETISANMDSYVSGIYI